MYKVLMFGGRNWSKLGPITRELKRLIKRHGERDLLIISGGAPGADQMSAYAANKHNVHAAVVKALWPTRHNGAGPQRNEVMKSLEPAEAICFHEDLSKSRGSADMKRRLDKAGIPVKVVAK